MAFIAKEWMKNGTKVETPDGSGIITNMHYTDKGDKKLVYFIDVKLDSKPDEYSQCYPPSEIKLYIYY